MNRGVKNLPDGVLTFHYSVTATTNFLTWTFPLQFEFFQKGREFVENGDWFKRGIGTLKSIRAATEPKNLFDPCSKSLWTAVSTTRPLGWRPISMRGLMDSHRKLRIQRFRKNSKRG